MGKNETIDRPFDLEVPLSFFIMYNDLTIETKKR